MMISKYRYSKHSKYWISYFVESRWGLQYSLAEGVVCSTKCIQMYQLYPLSPQHPPSGTFHGKGDRYNISLIGSLPENSAAGQQKEQPKHKYPQINSMSTATIATCSQSCWNLRRVHRKIIHFGVPRRVIPQTWMNMYWSNPRKLAKSYGFSSRFVPKKTKPMRPISSPKKGTSLCCSAGPSWSVGSCDKRGAHPWLKDAEWPGIRTCWALAATKHPLSVMEWKTAG